MAEGANPTLKGVGSSFSTPLFIYNNKTELR